METVIALFIIAGGIAVVAALYASTLGMQDKDVQAAVLVMLGKSRVAELRGLAADYAGFQNLESQNGSTAPSDFPDYQVETTVQGAAVPYPCAGLDSLDFTASYKRVQVRVTGPDGRALSLSTLVGAPPTAVQDLIVTQSSGGSLLARGGQADFQAELRATDGTPIPDLQFDFYIDFSSGYGRLQEDPDGRTAHFFNQIVNLTGPNLYTGGDIRMVARTYYAGEEYRGVSSPITLAP